MTENISMQNSESPVGHNDIEYSSEAELMSEFYNYMSDPTNVENATNYLFHSLLDETILGVVFEVHHALKTGTGNAVEGQAEDNKPHSIVDMPDFDVFGTSIAKIAKKTMDCNCYCPICDRLVAACKFGPHLEKCMGMGRNSSRIASQRLASARNSSGNYFGANLTDDEDDADWSGEKKKKKIQTPQRNGGKKNGKSS